MQFQRAIDRELDLWLLRGSEPSQLEDELADAYAALASHPYLGRRMSRKDCYKYRLARTGFFVVYKVRPRLRRIEVVALIHGRSMSHR